MLTLAPWLLPQDIHFCGAPRPLDLVGVDVTITGIISPGSRRRTRLDLQLKCTSQDLLEDKGIRYPLEIKN